MSGKVNGQWHHQASIYNSTESTLRYTKVNSNTKQNKNKKLMIEQKTNLSIKQESLLLIQFPDLNPIKGSYIIFWKYNQHPWRRILL